MADTINFEITTSQPEVAATLEDLRYLVFEGMAGKAPRINTTNNHWEVYNNDTQTWVDTGVNATGADGYTPTVTASQTTGGVLLTISDGRPGGVINTYFIRDGAAGADGEDGHSPYINSTGYWVFWNDSTGAWVTTNYKAAGRDGEDGHSPYIGANGHWFAWSEYLAMFDDTGVPAQGDAGYSPEVTVESIQGGHTVTITDEEHPQGQSFNVMNGMDGISEDVKVALLNCFEHVAWIDADGQDYYDALEAALYPPKTLVSISAVFTQGSAVIYDTDSLNTLKQYLVVTAHFDDLSSQTITGYSLSGTLTVGTSTITVSYDGKTTTFNVTVTEAPTVIVRGTLGFDGTNDCLKVSDGVYQSKRALRNPFGMILQNGKQYVIDLGSAFSAYDVSVRSAVGNTAGVSFETPVNDIIEYAALFEGTIRSGWVGQAYSFVANTATDNVLLLVFRNKGSTDLSQTDYDTIAENLTITVT